MCSIHTTGVCSHCLVPGIFFSDFPIRGWLAGSECNYQVGKVEAFFIKTVSVLAVEICVFLLQQRLVNKLISQVQFNCLSPNICCISLSVIIKSLSLSEGGKKLALHGKIWSTFSETCYRNQDFIFLRAKSQNLEKILCSQQFLLLAYKCSMCTTKHCFNYYHNQRTIS